MIRHAFAEFSTLFNSFDYPIHISINLSSAELNSVDLAEYIREQASTYKIRPHWIDFEITETFAADSKAIPLLYDLVEQGYSLTIDDFGSGYTSIVQLVQYPIKRIKFDQAFLETIIETGKQSVLEPLIQLCHSQMMKVTAEGIESQEMQQWLTRYHCDYMQGFYLAPPMPLREIQYWNNNDTEISYEECNYRVS